jgi:predicted TIM-barrel fold metal-dependent hydrolase
VKRILRIGLAVVQIVLLSACSRRASGRAEMDSDILTEVNRIRAIDNHAHPVRFVRSSEQDREFDALPVDNMEPASDPLQLRPDDPGVLEAWRALWNYPYHDTTAQHIAAWKEHKQRIAQQHAEGHPAWVLDRAGIDVMLANRVHLGTSIQPPRFRWVPYGDALLFPLDNSRLAATNSDRKAFFIDEDAVRAQYLRDAGLGAMPKTLDDYLGIVVTPALERHKQGGAIAEKFEIAYLRAFGFDKVERAAAEKVYGTFINARNPPADEEYKVLQDYLFRFIVSECGRLGMAVHIHTAAGAGGYFDVRGANPLLLEPLFNDPELRKTTFVLVHGGWPYTREITALLTKPNVYLDYSMQSLLFTAPSIGQTLRQWLEWVPEKVLFGTDAYPYSDALGWEESAWLAAKRSREALAIALTGMLRDGEISRERARELAGMVLRENARKLYGF